MTQFQTKAIGNTLENLFSQDPIYLVVHFLFKILLKKAP